jgi:anthranilate phosphoribosyltransferase
MQLKDGQITEMSIDPKSLNVNAEKFENLIGDDADFNAKKMIEIFKGQDNDFSKAVCLNAAAGLIVSEKFTKFSEAYTEARKHILSGNTFQHLKKIQNV